MSDLISVFRVEITQGIGSVQCCLPVLPQFQNHHLAGRCVALVGNRINRHQNVGLWEIRRSATNWNVEADDDEFPCHALNTPVEIV